LSAAPAVGAVGTYRSDCAVVALPIDDVRAMLPAGVAPGPQTLAPPGHHPVLFMFGRHRGVHPVILPIRGGSYHEMITAVPFLDYPDGAKTDSGSVYRGPYAFMPRLYLDDWIFVVLGWFYGYDKVRARIEDTGDAYRVRSLVRRRPIVSGRFLPRGEAGPVSDFPNFAAVAPAFRQPFLGKFFFGPIVCSIMAFELEKAVMRPVEARIAVETAYLPGMPAREFRVPGIDASPLGAFHIEVPWTLSYPMRCACLPGGAGENA
jgi:hypothetical protein